jgi:hypothetical protein
MVALPFFSCEILRKNPSLGFFIYKMDKIELIFIEQIGSILTKHINYLVQCLANSKHLINQANVISIITLRKHL